MVKQNAELTLFTLPSHLQAQLFLLVAALVAAVLLAYVLVLDYLEVNRSSF
jgi:hypothetical protein